MGDRLKDQRQTLGAGQVSGIARTEQCCSSVGMRTERAIAPTSTRAITWTGGGKAGIIGWAVRDRLPPPAHVIGLRQVDGMARRSSTVKSTYETVLRLFSMPNFAGRPEVRHSDLRLPSSICNPSLGCCSPSVVMLV
jgi:hypothetical protein